jgi:hypothetical protein
MFVFPIFILFLMGGNTLPQDSRKVKKIGGELPVKTKIGTFSGEISKGWEINQFW